MGDRFYEQQKLAPKRRVLKSDLIKEINTYLGYEVAGLDKLTIKTLDELFYGIVYKVNTIENGN